MTADLGAEIRQDDLQRLYAGAQGPCLWSGQNAAALIATLSKAEAQGLDPAIFHLRDIARLDGSSTDKALRDLLLSDAALRYARIMTRGQVDPATVDADIDFDIYPGDVLPGLKSALNGGDVSAWLASLPPPQPQYAALVALLAHYRTLAAQGGWPVIGTPETSVKPGKSSPLVATLRERLAAEGYLATAEGGDVLTGDVLAALKHFQERHGLDTDGALGKKTVAALNVSAAARAEQIALNLERWRQLSRGIPPTRIEVNTAAATAALIVDQKPVLRMRTVVGAKKTPTPLVRSDIRAVVVNPPWVVPVSIVRKEIMPALKRNPDYLEAHNMEWKNGQIVQAPGPKNSLGRIKFELHSSFDVYLHDTPARSLFNKGDRDARARSHGCVRLEKPLDLAERLLQDNANWPRERIEAAIEEGGTQRVQMATDIPVVITYWTAFAGESGDAEFREDIYGRDARLAAALPHGGEQAPAAGMGPVSMAPVGGAKVGVCMA
ncbi:L,D-transpeptidase family protein [Parvibaculum sp.]|uniref:L,D-transpeptidase family protein n=1 Tax=Parvibaculum sp. TaxID=2024848 RepID=UPI0032100ACF